MLSALFKGCVFLLACALLSTSQNLQAVQLAGAPDIIQISVTHLREVKDQLRKGLGISWGPEKKQDVLVLLEDGSCQEVKLTRVYSVSSHPYVELIKAEPQIGPWAPFNDEFGERPRSTMVWRVEIPYFLEAKNQMDKALTKVAEGPGFAYFRTVAGAQLEIIRPILSPNTKAGIPNKPPAGIIDLAGMNHLSIPVLADPENPTAIPPVDILIRQQITAATGGGVTWDIITQFLTPVPYFDGNGQFVFFTHPNIEYSRQPNPFINPISALPDGSPFGATESSTSFSHAWVAPGSGLDEAGAAAMTAVENQMIAAGFQSTLRLDAQLLGFPVATNVFHYYTGIDNIDVQILNAAFENHPTVQ